MFRFPITMLLGFLFLLLPDVAQAAVVTIDGTIKSVDAKKRTITVQTKTKTLELDVSRKAKISVKSETAKLDSLKVGQKVKLSYHEGLEIVLKIEAAATDVHEGFVSLFDGRSLTGWKGDKRYWQVVNGNIVGHKTKLKGMTGLVCDDKFKNFVLKIQFKAFKGNSGVYFRCKSLPEHKLSGYQADITPGHKLMGALIEEMGSKGHRIVSQSSDKQVGALVAIIKKDNWNVMEIQATGSRIRILINGYEIRDGNDPRGPKSGLIGLELRGLDTSILFKDILIKKLPD